MPLTQEEQDNLRTIAVAFFGEEASTWMMNDGMLEVITKVLNESRQCSAAMDYVPRPGIVDRNYLRRQLVQLAKRLTTRDKDYYICRLAVQRSWRTEAQMVGMGYQ